MPALLLGALDGANHTEVAYRTIKRRIIELEMAPGSQFTEGDLAREAGVSKSPVRDALARLQRDGLVESVPRSGYLVSQITLRSTADLCEFRSIVEPNAARLAAERGTDTKTIDRLDELASVALSESWESSPQAIETYLRSNFEFDAYIANSGGNERLAASIIGVLDDLERVLRLILPILKWSESRVEQRKALVTALQKRDPDGAFDAVLMRTQESAQEITATLLQHSTVRDVNIQFAPR